MLIYIATAPNANTTKALDLWHDHSRLINSSSISHSLAITLHDLIANFLVVAAHSTQPPNLLGNEFSLVSCLYIGIFEIEAHAHFSSSLLTRFSIDECITATFC